ncbi:MAG: helix-turn-helix transcriptional regulator, partial [Bradyrhizobium sp.]|nr:helix-turn-helix transcriptional regulator [Bradyrhizobium sp.]
DGTAATALTQRERQALALLGQAKSYQAIADQFGSSYKTVINLTYRLRQKLGARSLPDLVRLAVEMSRPSL